MRVGISSSLGKMVRAALHYAVPPTCPACGRIVSEDHSFCQSCWQAQHFLGPPWCATCHLPLPPVAPGLPGDVDQRQCAACMQRPPRHDGLDAVLAYGEVARTVALRLKRGRRVGLARMIAHHMRRHLPDDQHSWLLVPVPLHPLRLWSRGFNQSVLIGRALASAHGMTMLPDALVRKRHTPLLQGKGRLARARALRGAIAVNPRRAAEIGGQRIILIDDVYTSGATSHACVAALKRARASEVRILCWSRVLPDGMDFAGIDTARAGPNIRDDGEG